MTGRVADLEAVLAEKDEELNYLRGDSGGNREQELLERIEEDEAKISALESMLRNAQDVEALEKKWKQAESKLQEEGRRTQKLVQQLLKLKEEKESLLLELSSVRSELANQGRRHSSVNGPQDTSMDDDCDPMTDDADTTLPLPDEGTVEYIERLLAAIDRLRGERDSLRRDVHFLESESRFAIEALEAKLSVSMATTSAGPNETARTIGQMKLEMDALHSHLEDVQAAYDLGMRQKNQELQRLSRALTALGVVVGRVGYVDRATNHDGSEELIDQVGREHLRELEGKLEDTMLCLDAVTSQRDDLAEALRKKEAPWEDEVQAIRFSQQESNRTIQDLSSQIDELTKTVEQVESERTSLALQVTNLEADLQKAQDEVAEAERRYSDLQFHQLSSMSSTEATQSLRQQIKELEMRVMRRTEQVGIHQHDIRRLETNIRLQEERIGEMTMELEMMTAEKAAMVEDCADAREVRDDALGRMEEMEEAMEALESSVEQSDSTVVSLVSVLFDTVAKARRAIQSSTPSDSLNEQLHDAFDHIDELKEQNGHLEHAVQKYNERINQLTAQIVSLEGQYASTIASTDALKSNFDVQSAALQDEMDLLRDAKECMEEAHSTATRELEMELERLRHRVRDLEHGSLQRSSEANVIQQSKERDLEQLQSQVSSLEAALADAESSYQSKLQEYEDAMKSLTESKQQTEEELAAVRDELGLAETERGRASGALEAELAEERQSREQAQQSFDRLEQDRQRLVSELDQLHNTLESVRDELDAEKDRFAQLEEKNVQEFDKLNDQIHELSMRLEEEQQSRRSEGHEHESAFSIYKQQHDVVVMELQQDLERLREEVDRAENYRLASEEEKTALQEQMTDLVAKIEQNKTFQRHFEGQIQERERSIETLKSDMYDVRAKLDAAEQANAKVTLNLSLLTAQHKREMAEAQREVERLRSKSNLEQTIAELEERNQEMDQLLKEKCTEIEENDDRTLEMLKENKKLASKVESLTRKVQTLQTKLATLKASSPKADSKSDASSKISPLADTSSRPRSMSSNQSSLAQTQNRPSTSSSRSLSRVASGPSMALRAKTPETQLPPVPQRSKVPEKPTSPVGETLSVAGKKRRAPDDFEFLPTTTITATSTTREGMFSKQQQASFLELSNDLQDENDWVIGHLRTLNVPLNVTAFALEPITRLLAIGTSSGSIFIYGGPGVDVKINTPSSVSVKFLNFSLPSRKILCIDSNNQLHIWDLATFGAPEYLTSARFDHVNTIHVSPSLSHVFLALQIGEIKTYDLGCLRKSPYTFPNMWKLYQQDMLAQGVSSLVDSKSQPCVDQALHPRDLNKMFIAYEGGVILCDVTERKTIRAYELILPPGAPGGAGYGFGDILTHRQPPVTCLAIHPSGHFFAVGHADGAMAFWAVDDDNSPLTVFTFDEDNVHMIDSVKLEAHLQVDGQAAQQLSIREPVIKMAWSGYPNSTDPRGGETTLTVLGGLDPTHGGNATVLWFPPFQPAAGTKTQPGELDPIYRAAMVNSLGPVDLAEYAVGGEIQDFLLVPKESPHYAGQYDPYAVLLLVATKDGDRIVRAYSFPPSRTIQSESQTSEGAQPSQSHEAGADLAEHPDRPPFIDLALPFSPLSGGAGLRGGYLLTLEADAYERICEAGKSASQSALAVKLDGGQAFADQTKHDEIRLTKYQPHRLMITYNANLRILFFDVSAQLLVGGELEAFTGHFPNPLVALTVELESVWGELLSRGKCTSSNFPAIQAVHLAIEALEVATVLDTGEVVVHRFNSPPTSSKTAHNDDIVLLHSSPIESHSRLSPYFCLKNKGKVEACSIADTGFLAVSYSNGSVVVVDMRGPSIIYSSDPNTKDKHRLSPSKHRGASVDIAKALTWTISRLEEDEKLRVRLIVSRNSGTQEVITLVPSGSPAVWGVSGEPVATHGVSEPLNEGVFVIDSKTGTRIGATGSLLASSYRSESPNSPSILITVGAKGAKTYTNISGDRIAKADWGVRAGNAIAAQVVQRMASRALAVVTDKEEVFAYSLPHLELITRFKLLPLDRGHLSIDHSGDFLAFSPGPSGGTINQVIYGTFFDIRRAYSPPEVDFAMKPCKIPQPQPISMGPPSLVGTWLSFGQSTSGDQLDNLLGGPDRAELVAQRSREAAERSPSGAAGGASTTAASLAATAASAQASIYNKLSSALGERGQLLGGLEESFNSLEQGSRGMVAQDLEANGSSERWKDLELELDDLSTKLQEINDQLGELSSKPELLSTSMLRAIQRHRELHQDNVRELKRTKGNVKSALDQATLLSGVRNDIDAYKSSAADSLLAERGRIDSSHRMTDDIIDQAYETRAEFSRQRTSLAGINTRIVQVMNTMPGINNLIGMIKSRRRRDAIIMGVVIGVCMILLLSYMRS
ncbi:hypothetical protein H1R20_g5200, partial [Candolleomyces eurysporus]